MTLIACGIVAVAVALLVALWRPDPHSWHSRDTRNHQAVAVVVFLAIGAILILYGVRS